MNGLLDLGRITRLVEAAALAPSPHNIQPARWRFTADGRVELYEDTTRWLSVGDPTGRDNALALGAAWEGMALALSTQGHGLAEERLEDLTWPSSSEARFRRAASARFVSGFQQDALAEAVIRRQSFRGIFPLAGDAEKSALRELGNGHSALIIEEAAHVAKIAMWHDDAAAYGIRNPQFTEELFRWMRFSTADQNWARDGLSTDCMALSWIEAAVARFALRPRMVRLLCALSLEGLLVSEAVKVRSAAGIVLLHGAEDRSWFDSGRSFYRFWLDLTRAGLCAVPMSALADSEHHAALLRQAFPLPRGQRLVAILRVGKMPAARIPRSARLNAAELVLPPQA
jgi:nitroreductase